MLNFVSKLNLEGKISELHAKEINETLEKASEALIKDTLAELGKEVLKILDIYKCGRHKKLRNYLTKIIKYEI